MKASKISKQSKHHNQVGTSPTQKTVLSWFSMKQESLHQFKDGIIGHESSKQGSVPEIRTKSVSPLQSANAGYPL